MSVQPLVLVVDDEPGILRLLKQELSVQGFRVIGASSGEEALRLAEEHRPDIVLLDILMPDISGLEVMRGLRQRSNAPVILVTARDTDMDKIRGLELGADDYIVKPFNPEEVAARVRAVLRRASGLPPGGRRLLSAGGLEIDLERRLVMRQGKLVPLTRTEWQLLQHLAAHAGKVLTNRELLSKVWGPEYGDDVQYLRVWVARLRRKLGDSAARQAIIKTMPGIGYMLEASPVSPER